MTFTRVAGAVAIAITILTGQTFAQHHEAHVRKTGLPHDVPDFAAKPTVRAARSGAWSAAGTWSTNRVPGAGDVVRIPSGITVTYDVVSDAALYLPFAQLAPFPLASVGLVVLLSIVSEMAGALGPMVGAPRRYDGPMGKSDRAFVFGALGLYVGLGGPLSDGAYWIMPVVSLLIAINVWNRVRRGVAEAGARGGAQR